MEIKKFRLLNHDGTSNIHKLKTFSELNDLYHRFLSASKLEFIFSIIFIYLIINLFFGLIYFMIGPAGLSGVKSVNSFDFFIECFFFSVQTFSTIGYGHVSPNSIADNIIVSIQALAGLVSIAIMSGLFFARFSKATSRVAFSKVALINQHEGHTVLCFRMANARRNQIIEAQTSIVLLKDTITKEGERIRKLTDLTLMRKKTPIFALSWIVFHIIDENSPLYQKNLEDLQKMNTEILVLVSGHDDTFNQTVHSRFSYTADDILFNKQFVDIIIRDSDNKVTVDVENISNTKT